MLAFKGPMWVSWLMMCTGWTPTSPSCQSSWTFVRRQGLGVLDPRVMYLKTMAKGSQHFLTPLSPRCMIALLENMLVCRTCLIDSGADRSSLRHDRSDVFEPHLHSHTRANMERWGLIVLDSLSAVVVLLAGGGAIGKDTRMQECFRQCNCFC